MNRRGFFSRALGGIAAVLGLRPADEVGEAYCLLTAPYIEPPALEFDQSRFDDLFSRPTPQPVWTGNAWSWPE